MLKNLLTQVYLLSDLKFFMLNHIASRKELQQFEITLRDIISVVHIFHLVSQQTFIRRDQALLRIGDTLKLPMKFASKDPSFVKWDGLWWL